MTYITSFDGMKTVALNKIEWVKGLDMADAYIRERCASAQQGDQDSKNYLLDHEDCWIGQLYINDEMWGTIAWRDLPKMADRIADGAGDKAINLQKIAKSTGIKVNITPMRRNFTF